MLAKFSFNPLRTALFLALCLVFLAGCRGNPQFAGRTPLAGNQNIEYISLPSVDNIPTPNAQQITASKARVPYQYREKKPNNLFDFATNLDPSTNRSIPAN